jgi:hypothetical protein
MRVCLLLSKGMEVADVMSAARLLRRAWLGGDGDDGLSSAVFFFSPVGKFFSWVFFLSLCLNEHMLSGQRWRFFGNNGSGSVCLFVFFRLGLLRMKLDGSGMID